LWYRCGATSPKSIDTSGRPAGSGKKTAATLRFDNDILAAFRATGKGWQTRMNNALREWLKEHKPA